MWREGTRTSCLFWERISGPNGLCYETVRFSTVIQAQASQDHLSKLVDQAALGRTREECDTFSRRSQYWNCNGRRAGLTMTKFDKNKHTKVSGGLTQM